MQTIATSRKQVPAIYKKVTWQPGTKNLDLGAGRFPELFTEALKASGVKNYPYDPENPAISVLPEGEYDTVTLNNVLNVIKDKATRLKLVETALKKLKPDGTLYILIYEGDRSGEPKKTRDGWQNNQKKGFYITEIQGGYLHPKIIQKCGIICLKRSLFGV